MTPNPDSYTVAPRRNTDDLPIHVKGSATWVRGENQSGYYVSAHQRYTPVEFYSFSTTNDQGQAVTGDAWFKLTETPDEQWVTRLVDILELENDLNLGWWNTDEPQHTTGQHRIHLPPITTDAPAEPMADIAATIGATITAPTDTTAPQTTNGGNRTLSGVAPPQFNGDRNMTETFMDKFLGYELTNYDTKQFSTPYLKAALFLTYLNGPKIDAWARSKRNWLRDQTKYHGATINDEYLWTQLKADFESAYTDTDAKIVAHQKLRDLKMVGSDIDTYVAEFDRLITETGYHANDWGSLLKFKEGLQPKLVTEILTHVTPAPATLEQWKKSARARQTVYKELKNAGLLRNPAYSHTPAQTFPRFDPQKMALALGIRNYVPPHLRQQPAVGKPPQQPRYQNQNQVVPMDVDAGRVFTPLSENERATLRARGACFRCRQPGHMSRFCPLKGKQQPNPAQVRATQTPAPEPPKPTLSPQDKWEMIKKIGFNGFVEAAAERPEEEQLAFLDAMQDFYPAQN